MLMTDLIAKKRDGGELSTEEIDFMIQGLRTIRCPPCAWRSFSAA